MILGLLGAGVGAIFTSVPRELLLRWKGAPHAMNYRGVLLPVMLGLAVATGLAVVTMAIGGGGTLGRGRVYAHLPFRLAVGGAIVAVAAVGFYDDVRHGPGRGVAGHFGELLRGRLTTGMTKLVVILGASALVSWSAHVPGIRMALGVLVMAGSANLWNLLDVRPGRAIKYFFVAALALSFPYSRFGDVLLPAGLGAAAAVSISDLRERAMLGDAGSNVLGFVIGIGLFRTLPAWGLAVALGVVLALHVLAETFTLSRMIEALRPLRWFDRIGRLKDVPDRP
jgi:UDP-N-acetylmuramyl pentapeptide phosphotransferase/UDP-N-acetylglucosamine-1-phosphate transferase